ncbi:hypothetical protein TNCV_4330531 [Trichonephila clavipes]|nr:hypothetical protein TNCV_4330531 [Trichonephila clavipes]
MCEGLQQTPAEVTAAESVRNAPEQGRASRLSHWRSDCPTEDLKGGPSVCHEIRGSPASNTKGQTPHTSCQRIGHVELKCGAVRATDEKLHE